MHRALPTVARSGREGETGSQRADRTSAQFGTRWRRCSCSLQNGIRWERSDQEQWVRTPE